MPKAPVTHFNDYAVMQRKAPAPRESWWLCPPEDFRARWEREVPRMQLAPINQSIKPLVLGGVLP